MIHELETLNALAKHRTMGKAATSLRITQSSVSKRIQSLEAISNKELVVKRGRYVELTHAGNLLLERALPLLRELKEVVGDEPERDLSRITVGFSDSILSSWGAKMIGKYANQNKNVLLEPHAHRTPVIVDKVVAGDYIIAIVGGEPKNYPGLHFEKIGEEEMVIVGTRGSLFCAEVTSGTWGAISNEIEAKKIVVEERSEFLSPIAHMARGGFCRGLVPYSVALSAGFTKKEMKKTGVSRPIFAVARKRALMRDDIAHFLEYATTYLGKI